MPRIYKDGRSKQVGRRQYERLWKPRGWRLTNRTVSAQESPEPSEAGESPDTQQEG
jgi:hypothetical protein